MAENWELFADFMSHQIKTNFTPDPVPMSDAVEIPVPSIPDGGECSSVGDFYGETAYEDFAMRMNQALAWNPFRDRAGWIRVTR